MYRQKKNNKTAAIHGEREEEAAGGDTELVHTHVASKKGRGIRPACTRAKARSKSIDPKLWLCDEDSVLTDPRHNPKLTYDAREYLAFLPVCST